MSYVLLNGKRYYKDDRTGKVHLDNVSQTAADQRAHAAVLKDPMYRITRLFQRAIRLLTVSVAGGAILLISSYCIREQVQLQNPFHLPAVNTEFQLEIRDTADIKSQLEKVSGRIVDVFSYWMER